MFACVAFQLRLQAAKPRRGFNEALECFPTRASQCAFGWIGIAEKLPVQAARRIKLQDAAGRVADDSTGRGCLRTVEESVAEALCPFANRGMDLVIFGALRSFCDQPERCCTLPVGISALAEE